MPLNSSRINLQFFISFLQQISYALITILGLISITFLIGRVIPIDPVIAITGDRVPADTYELVKNEMGLNLPLYKQFINYIFHAMQGDFGKSFFTNNLIIDDIKHVFPATIELAFFAMFISTTLGIPLGILAAVYKDKWIDHLIRSISLIGNSLSIYWLGLMGLMVFYIQLDLSAGPGRLDAHLEDYNTHSGFVILESFWNRDWEIFINSLSHILLPASLLAYYKLAYICRMTRIFMLEQLNQEYITIARIKGIPEWRVVFIHALRNAAVPIITVIGLSFGSVLEGSTFIETIFLWPGLGYYLSQALKNADMNAILGSTIIIGFTFIIINLLTDFLYKLVDPRIQIRKINYK